MEKEKKSYIVGILLLLSMIAIPLFNQGIMCGDELTTRFCAMQGWGNFFKSFMQEQVSKGRTLAVAAALPSYLGFLFSGNQYFKIIQVASIFLNAFLFAFLAARLLKNKKFGVMLFVFSLSFLPVSFENTAPNAFNTLFNIPFSFLLLSYILFLDYIDWGSKKKLAVSMILLFITEMSYEAFIALTPVYFFILLYRINIKADFKKILLYLSVPFLVSCLYLAVYVIFAKINVSNYDGNQMGIYGLHSSLKIIWHLFKAALPGFFVWGSDKYRFLLRRYMDFSAGEAVRIGILAVIFISVIGHLIQKKEEDASKTVWKQFGVIVCGLICMILPSLPIAVSEMYQGAVGENGFVALPVTYFSYYFAVFVVCYLIWFVFRKNWQTVVLLAMFTVMLLGVQFSNGVFSEEQNRNFDRLEQIENRLKTDVFRQFGATSFAADDIFETVNSMAFYDSYWTQYSNYLGNQTEILNKEGSENENRIYLRYNKMYIWYQDDLYVLTYDMVMGKDLVIITDQNCSFQEYKDPKMDHGLYVYHFKKSELQ